jgi:hypothetical protein
MIRFDLKRFDGRILGEVDNQFFLGFYHERDWKVKTISVSQPQRVHDFLSHLGYLNVRSVRSPLVPNYKVVLSQASTSDQSAREHPLLAEYSAIVGSLMYLANSIRPDLSFARSTLARFMSDPCDQHIEAAIHVLWYLSGTRELKLVFGKFGSGAKVGSGVGDGYRHSFSAFGGSTFAADPDTRRGITGEVITMFGSTIHWCSFRQSSISKDTMVAELEYYAASSAASSVCDAAAFFRTLWMEFGYNLDVPIPLFVDNQSTRDIIGKSRISDRGSMLRFKSIMSANGLHL